MNVLELISLAPLMSRSAGDPELTIGLIDGRVLTDHPRFDASSIEVVGAAPTGPRPVTDAPSAIHATSIASILVASQASGAHGICPAVHLLNYPLFTPGRSDRVSTQELAAAIVDTVDRGAKIVNLSLSVHPPAAASPIRDALDYAATRDAVVVAATGNAVGFGGSELTRHRSVIPVVSYDLSGHPSRRSTFARSIGTRGVGAPGVAPMPVDAADGRPAVGGTSIAAAIVTGTVALLRSEFPHLRADLIVDAVIRSVPTRRSVLPGLLNASRAFELLRGRHPIPKEIPA